MLTFIATVVWMGVELEIWRDEHTKLYQAEYHGELFHSPDMDDLWTDICINESPEQPCFT